MPRIKDAEQAPFRIERITKKITKPKNIGSICKNICISAVIICDIKKYIT